MKHVRRWVYRHGFRPKKSSIFFSPGLAAIYEFEDGWESVLDVIKNS